MYINTLEMIVVIQNTAQVIVVHPHVMHHTLPHHARPLCTTLCNVLPYSMPHTTHTIPSQANGHMPHHTTPYAHHAHHIQHARENCMHLSGPATKVSSVYEVRLPEDVTRFLEQFSVVVSLGIDFDATPLECLGLVGYIPKMISLIIMPIVLVLLLFLYTVVRRSLCHCAPPAGPQDIEDNRVGEKEELQGDLESKTWLLEATPLALRLLFLIYPIVSRISFQAFSFHTFSGDASYLRADVRIQKGSIAHTNATNAALVGIFLYPVGVLGLFGTLLLRARKDIIAQQQTNLSTAVAFLHSEYTARFCYWELVEMARRLLLVGVFVTVKQGSVEQLVYGTLVAVVHLAVQVGIRAWYVSADTVMGYEIWLVWKRPSAFAPCLPITAGGAAIQISGGRHARRVMLNATRCALCCIPHLQVRSAHAA